MLTKTIHCPNCKSTDCRSDQEGEYEIKCNQCGDEFDEFDVTPDWIVSPPSLTDDPVFIDLIRTYTNLSVMSSLTPQRDQAIKLADYIEAWMYDNRPDFKHHEI